MGRIGAARVIAVALGSNLGDRHAHLDYAVDRLGEFLDDIRTSSYAETTPVGTPDVQSSYLNAVCVGWSGAPARDLLDRLLRIEAERGRERPYFNAPRTLDLDLVLAGDEVVDEPGLVVPHPRFRERPFVLAGLCEVAPDLVDPVTGLTVDALRARL